MSTTTQILFNSPALHSLKREQLMKLCKIHSLKANGKNVELIQRLRQHAESLPRDSPLSVAARSECDGPIPSKPMETDDLDQQAMQVDEVQPTVYMPRPSEQWEVVMDSIEEVEEESSQGSLSSQRTVNNIGTGEFGTGGSAASTVTSSIRALATSLGLRRTMTKPPSGSTSSKTTTVSCIPDNDDLANNSKPYSMIPAATTLPQTDHFILDTGRPSLGGTDESPLPGHTLRPGIPAPPNARLSMGLGIGVPTTPTRKAQPTTTIRLVSNPLSQQDCVSYDERESGTPQLKPFQTTFDISFGSPAQGTAFNSGFTGLTSWPPKRTDDAKMTLIHSMLTSDVITPSKALPQACGGADEEGESQVKMSPPSPRLSVPTSAPFIFGSPHHRVSNNQFREAASSVLEEMNARLREEGVDEIGVDIINKLHPARESSVAQRETKPIPTLKRGEITCKFDDVHQREFNKMEGIDTLRKRQPHSKEVQPETKKRDEERGNAVVGRKRKSSAIEQDARSLKPNVANRARVSRTRVISNGRPPKNIPGGFGLDDEDEEAPDDPRAGKRVRVDSDSLKMTEESKRKEEERELQLEKEKEGIKKKLEANRARRRSSAAARKSLGRNGPRPSVLIKPKPKASRFGFLASAKSLVQSVWSRGKPSNPPSNIPKLTAPPAQAVHGQGSLPKDEKGKEKMAPPPFVPNRKAALAPAKPTTLVASGNKTTALSAIPNNLASECRPASHSKGSLVSTRWSRSPLPDISTFSSNSSFSTASRKSKDTRASSVLGTSKSRTSAGVSSVGTRISGLRTSNTTGSDTISSMGTKRSIGGGSRNSSLGTAVLSSSSTRTTARSSSRLLAPTASSLAKTIHPSSTSVITGTPPSFAGDAGRLRNERRSENTALGSITNSQATNRAEYPSCSHHSERIFTEPLLLPSSSNDFGEGGKEFSSNAALPKKNASLKRTLSGRKPRISRSKVIAKLASQRAASGCSISSSRSSSSGTSILKPRMGAADSTGRTRSSLGIKVARASYGSGGGGGFKSRPSGGNRALAVSAKRSARQSEYSRRRSSRVAPAQGHRERYEPMEQSSTTTGLNV